MRAGNGKVFSECSAEKIARSMPQKALESFINETDGLTSVYLAEVSSRHLGCGNIVYFWKTYFVKFAQQKEKMGSCNHHVLLSDVLYSLRCKTSGLLCQKKDLGDLIEKAYNLVWFMCGQKMH